MSQVSAVIDPQVIGSSGSGTHSTSSLVTSTSFQITGSPVSRSHGSGSPITRSKTLGATSLSRQVSDEDVQEAVSPQKLLQRRGS